MRDKAQAAKRELGGGGLSGAGSNQLCSHYGMRPDRRQEPRYGRIEGATWRKTASASKHMLRAPKAWAVDAGDLALIEALGVRYVLIHDLEQMRHYWARPETLRAKGFVFERNAGEQVALPLEWWRPSPGEADAVAEGLRERTPEPEPAGPVQGALW